MASLTYRPAIDGLRALAVLSVFIFHLNHQWLPGGFVGVDVFFVISGYLITSIINKDCQSGSFSLIKFYQRRIARIFPAFFTVGLATVAVAHFIYTPQDLASAGATLTAAVLSVANLKFMLQGNYFEISPDSQPFLHYWSLSVEEQFYMLFPLLFLLLFKIAPKYRFLTLMMLCVSCFLGCVVMTWWRPDWAFYLLPTRAWELFAGCLLAVYADRAAAAPGFRWPSWVSTAGLGTIVLSFLLVREGRTFPGFWALLPVLGAVGVLLPPANGARAVSEKWLAVAPLVVVGRMSYSLYLWHWPVFSLVDYKMYLASEPTRLALKVGISLLTATLSYWFVENPGRVFLNRRECRPFAYGFLAAAIALCVPWGVAIRKENYVNAELSDVRKGGIVFQSPRDTSSVILMGDSNGSMYGKVMKEICAERGAKLTVISVAAGDPLPSSNGKHAQLWLASLSVVQKEKPDCLVLACNWESRLRDDKERLSLAVEALMPHVGRLVLLNQPPLLPENANRASIRLGQRPPFREVAEMHRHRTETIAFLQRFTSEKCMVVDIASRFQTKDGKVLFLDGHGRQLYQDRGHLSGFGADFVRSDLEKSVSLSSSP